MSDEFATGDDGDTKGVLSASSSVPLSPSESSDVLPETVFSTLANTHCRIVLAALSASEDGTLSVTVLATILTDHSAVTASRGQTVEKLHHTILPKLADARLIAYDSQAETVHYADQARVEAVLELAASWTK